MSKQPTILKELQCPKCGSPLAQHTPGTQTIVCPACGSYVAIGSQSPSVIDKGRKMPASPVPIEIGKTFTVDGTDYFVMGRVAYEGWDSSDSSDKWRWNEWLLGADDGRMLWMSYDEKGFSLFTKMRFRAPFDVYKDQQIPLGEGKSVRVHERYPAKIIGVQGELTWQAKPGEKLFMVEAAAHGKRYSIQRTDEEMEVYEGYGLDETQIAQSFADEKWLKRIKGRKSNVGTQIIVSVICIVFAVIGLIMGGLADSSGELVLEQPVNINMASPIMTVDVPLDQVGRPAIVSLSSENRLPVNTSFDLEVSITSPNEVKTFLFAQSFWHETGSDSDGPWTDTRYNQSGMFVPTVAGNHQLELSLDEALGVDGASILVQVRRNHVMPMWYIVYAALVGLGGGFLLFNAIKNSQKVG